MESHNWNKLTSIIDRALDLDPPEREAYISEVCREDLPLKTEVVRFLEAIDASEHFWDDMIEASSVLVNEITSLETGVDINMIFPPLQQAGPYRVIKLIARGGMGNVYLAERSDGQFQRTVAIKILRHELSTKNHIRRFMAERDILSGLEHPNIARLYDAGITEDNRPYLVMEYVDGIPISSFCVNKSCTLNEKFELFSQVCKAVEYAHRNLIVHRDLKPDNILVKPDGTVKVLDFGIAKIVDKELTPEMPNQERENLHMLSVRYAAPEQVTLEKVTTSTDVYALGLLLYEMVAGRPPFDLKGKKLNEAAQIICNEKPEKPSSKISDSRLSRKIKGDLDAIILKALSKKPENRYSSAKQFIDDIHLYQTGNPVSVYPNTFHYRARKFLSRRPGVVLTVLAGIIVIGGYLVILQLHADNLKAERDRAEMEASRAGFITDFLIDLFETADPTLAPGSDLSVRDLLDRGIERVDALAAQPDVEAELSLTMARTYHALALYDEALALAERAVVIYRDLDEEGLLLAGALNQKGIILRALGDYESAEPLYRKSLAMRRNILGDEHPDVATSMNNLGLLLQIVGNYDEAEPLLRQAVALQRKLLGDVNLCVATTLSNLGLLLRSKGDYEAAESLYLESLAIRRELLGDEHPDVARSLNNLGFLLRAKGDFEAAEPLYLESLAMRRKLLGDEHPDVAQSLNNLGVLLRVKGDYEAAEPYLREALAIRRNLLGNEHPDVARALNNLGSLLTRKGDYEAAEPYHREALAMRRNLLGNEHPDVARVLNNMGVLLKLKGNHDSAEPYLRDALAMRRKLLGDEHPDVATTLENLGLLYRDRGEFTLASTYLRDALDLRVRTLGEGHPDITGTQAHLHDVLVILQSVQPH